MPTLPPLAHVAESKIEIPAFAHPPHDTLVAPLHTGNETFAKLPITVNEATEDPSKIEEKTSEQPPPTVQMNIKVSGSGEKVTADDWLDCLDCVRLLPPATIPRSLTTILLTLPVIRRATSSRPFANIAATAAAMMTIDKCRSGGRTTTAIFVAIVGAAPAPVFRRLPVWQHMCRQGFNCNHLSHYCLKPPVFCVIFLYSVLWHSLVYEDLPSQRPWFVPYIPHSAQCQSFSTLYFFVKINEGHPESLLPS